ncbi:hypothetical protein D0Z00_002263 [Geotrichum galactomycetum]|uniref:Uncharacterized protein n=1 Tax=Geotrichum galactomycetum TaxID=27317 RepID=A0ACB6V4N1_9ASCO|nr:hypothetical protein D0Z00_002263 [Geotrichum candidum]
MSDKASVKEYPSNTLLKLAELSKVLMDDTDALELIGQLMLAFKSQDDRFDNFLTVDKKTAAMYGQICFDVIQATSGSKEEDIINTRKAFATVFANLSVIPEFADSIQFSDNDAVFQLLYQTVTSLNTASSVKGIAYLMIGNFAYTEQQSQSLISAFPDIISNVIQFLRTEKLSEDNLQSLQLIQNLLKNSIVNEFVKGSDGFLEVLERVLTQQFYPLFKAQAVAITGTILGNLGEDDADKIDFLICQALAGVYQKDDNSDVKGKIIGAISRVSSVIAQNLATKDGFADAATKSIELAFDYIYSTSQKSTDQWDLFNLLKALKTLGVLSGNNVQNQPAILEYIEHGAQAVRSEYIVHLLSTFSNQLTEYQKTLSESPNEEDRGKGALVKGSVMNLAYLASKIQSNQGEKYSSEIIDACQTAINNSALLATPIQQ